MKVLAWVLCKIVFWNSHYDGNGAFAFLPTHDGAKHRIYFTWCRRDMEQWHYFRTPHSKDRYRAWIGSPYGAICFEFGRKEK